MAAFTSVQSGNWNDNATWGTGAGVYPGSTSSQADTATIAATHTVDINVATVASGATVAVTVNAGSGGGAAGTLRVSAIMSAAWITTITTNYTAGQARGALVFSTGAAYTLMTAGAATLNGDFQMDASGASSTLIWSFGNYGITFGANSTISIRGRSKTHTAYLAAVPDGTYIDVDDGAGGDVSNWAVNDLVALQKSSSVRYGPVALTADGGFAGGMHRYTCTTSGSFDNNGIIINLSRSAEFTGAGTSSLLTFTAGATISYLEWFLFNDCHFSMGVGGTWFVGCSWYQGATGRGAGNLINTDAKIIITDAVAYWYGSSTGYWFGGRGDVTDIDITRATGLFTTSIYNGLMGPVSNGPRGGGTVLTNCYCSGAPLIYNALNYFSKNELIGCYGWGANAAIYPGIALVWAKDCTFGKDPGGNAVANSDDVNCKYYGGQMFFDNCLFASSSEVRVNGQPFEDHVISTNHDQVSGARKEWQPGGTCTKSAEATAGDFPAGVCDRVDPSSTIFPFHYRICFPCEAGCTPTLTFKQLRSGTIGTVTVSLGMMTCGVTGIATGGTVSPGTSVATHTVTFTGTTTLSGEIEVIVDVLDSSGGTFDIGDIAVTGNT